jgi:hypothetical protein
MMSEIQHDPLCTETNLEVMVPTNDKIPLVCKLEPLCICGVIGRARKDEREKAIDRLFGYRAEAAKVDGSLRMVFVAEEVISAIRGRFEDA